MLFIDKISTLNSIAAAGADAVLSGGIVTITGLPPFRKSWCQGYKYVVSAAGTAQIDTIDFASTAASTTYQIIVTYLDTTSNMVMVGTWTYTTPSSGFLAAAQDNFEAWAGAILAGNGYTVASPSNTVTITAPKNQILGVAVNTAYASSITASTTTAAVVQTGYGATLQTVYGLPTATTTTTNNGLVATYYYGQFTIPLIYTDAAGNSIQSEYIVFAYASEADYADFVTAMTNLGLV
jgi:hypothetical protein